MIHKKTGISTLLHRVFLVMFMFLTIGIISGCSSASDIINDLVDIDTSGDLEMQPVTVSGSSVPAALALDPSNCETTSIQAKLNDANIEEIDDWDIVDIDSVDIKSVSVDYTINSIDPDPFTGNLTCSVSLTSIDNPGLSNLVIDLPNINSAGAGSSHNVTITSDDIAIINSYLGDRDNHFQYCAECTGGSANSYNVTFYVTLDVDIEAEIDL